jgi:DNA-directed RNA polymerase
MVTPTSIWLKYADPTSVYSKRTPLLGDTARGATTKSKKAMNKLKEGEAKELSETLEAQDEAASPLDAEEFEDDVLDEAEEALEDEELEESGSKKKKPGPKLLKVWLPLMFPPVPKKGDWDVQRLRQSKYFFS